MCLKFAQTVTKIPAQPVVKFTHTDYFNMSAYEQELHYTQCKQFALQFSEGLYPITDFFDNIYDSEFVRNTLHEYASNTFDNEDIEEYIAADIEYFIMQNDLDGVTEQIRTKQRSQRLNKMNCALLTH